MKHTFSFLSGKAALFAIKHLHLGSGSTWPGHIAYGIDKNFLKNTFLQQKIKVILIAGTNGKTTTSKMLAHILEKNGLRVFQNEEGANLLNGLATSVIRNSKLNKTLPFDCAIFEVDENNLPHVLKEITPTAVVILNLFRDQLDRYGEVHTIAQKWHTSFAKLPQSTQVFLNADDPEIRNLVKSATGKSFYFSIPPQYFSKKPTSHDVDSIHCPQCGSVLQFSSIAYSHLGKYRCSNCRFSNISIRESNDTLDYPLFGTYNKYNTHAAIKVAQEVFSLSWPHIVQALTDFKPAFGRQERVLYKDKEVYVLLSKNPAGFNQSLDVISDITTQKASLVLVLNDRIPDGRDVSWIWDVDFDVLTRIASNVYVSGDRCYDLATRVKYTDFSKNNLFVSENLKQILDKAVVESKGKEVFILSTYSAMLEVRKVLTGKSIL